MRQNVGMSARIAAALVVAAVVGLLDAAAVTRHIAGAAGAIQYVPPSIWLVAPVIWIALALVLGALVLGVHVPMSSLAPLAFVILVTAYSCTGFGLISAGLGLRIRETAVLANVIFGVLLIFTGANVPLDTLPDWMSTISGWLPITHGIQAARQVAAGASLADVSGLVAKEAALGTVFAVLGYGLIRFMERQARQRASIEVA